MEPQTKKLACGIDGVGAMCEIEDLVNEVKRWSSVLSEWKNK